MKRRPLLLPALALAGLCGCEPKDFALVENAQPACELVLTGQARVDADLAFFTNAVDRIAGVRLPLVTTRTPGRNALVFDVVETDLFHEDAYAATFPDARTLAVRGTKHSCRWALNRILEERFGVVFCFPGEHGTHWPAASRLALLREPFSGDASLKIERNLYREDSAWERCVGGKEQKVDQFYNHNLCNIFPRRKYAEDPWREKLMPLRNGKRVKPLSDDGWQPCLSAPEAVSEAVKNIRAYLAAHPDEQVFSLTMNDNGGYCDCDACREMNGGTFDEPRKYGPPGTKSRSQTYFRWANAVAKEMAKTHPNVVFGLLAYGATIDPPPFRLEHNLLPFLCASVYQNHNERIWQKRYGLMKAWGEKCDAFGLWDYAYGMRFYAAPRVYNQVVDRYFSLKNTECPSFNAYFGEGSSLPGEGPKRWFYYKKIFDTTLTAEKALPVWYRACCGAEAAPFLQAYYELWERYWTGEAIRATSWYKSIDYGYCDFNSFAYLNALDDATIARSTELMEQAVAAAANSGTADQRIRARWLENCHRYYLARITLKRSYLGEAPYNGSSEPTETPAEVAALVAKLPAYSRAIEDVKTYAQRVLDSRGLSSWRWGRTYGDFPATSALDASFEGKLIAMAKHAGTPEVRQALAAVIADGRTTPRFKAIAKGLLEGPHGPDRFRALSSTDDEDSAAWMLENDGITIEKAAPTDGGNRWRIVGTGGWAAMSRTVGRGIPTGRMMMFSGRIENRSRHEIRVRIHYEAWGSRGTSRHVVVKPGETKVAAVPLESRSGTPKFYFIFNGMEKGDEVHVDAISLRDLE